MLERLRARLLRVMRVPPDPQPPAGAPGSVRVFRAGSNLYKLRLATWGIGQIGALFGILFSLGFLHQLERGVEQVQRELANAANAPATPTASQPAPAAAASNPSRAGGTATAVATPATPSTTVPATPANATTSAPAEPKKASRQRGRSGVRRLAERTPPWLFPFLSVVEWAGVLVYLLQIPVTFAMVRLDYELRWYIVTDRSLRIRSGLTTVQESTMSFANIQQVVVTQGPLQRLLGLADVRLQSAGGGAADETHGRGGDSLHTVVFHGVDNAVEIRDLVAERLRQFRATGLGDPDESAHVGATASADHASGASLAAARELLAEARALRQALS